MDAFKEIRGGIEAHVGAKVWMKNHRGRSRSIETVGILEHSFPSVFTVLVEHDGVQKRMSYTYSDVFTTHVEMTWLETK